METAVTKIISQLYDIGKFKERCNSKACENAPTKIVTVYSYTLSRGRVEIANIYLCDAHVKSVALLKNALRHAVKNGIIETEIKNL